MADEVPKGYHVILRVKCPDGSTIRYEQEEGDIQLAQNCWEAFADFEKRGERKKFTNKDSVDKED